MSTISTSLAKLTRQARPAWVPLLVASALAAGCGAVHASASGAAAGQPGASAHATASRQPTPVPTVTGGAVAGQPACVGWPEHAMHVTTPALFVPVAAERCVTGVETITGKGQWETATLEKATSDLAPLMAALRQPRGVHTPDTFCPELAMLPPQIVLLSASGQELVPLLPVTGCGLVQSAVLSAIAALHWQPVSVRLVAPVTPAVPPRPTQTATLSPKNVQPLPDQPVVAQ
jgi:hypothetical protein